MRIKEIKEKKNICFAKRMSSKRTHSKEDSNLEFSPLNHELLILIFDP